MSAEGFFGGGVSVYASDGSLAVAHADRVAYYNAPPPALAWPLRIGVVPSEADCFQHRKAVEDLDTAMTHGGTAVICQVLSGMGGLGKTQLAAHYARRKWSAHELDLLVWVTAGNRDSIISAYARAGRQIIGTDDSDPISAAGDFQAWLETTGQRWLVVLDDLADPGDLSGLWPPRHPTGRTVVTTRRRDAALSSAGRRLVAVSLFSPPEASNYLAAILAVHDRYDDPNQIRALAKDLGFLPLALAQAAAYVIDRRLESSEYRQRLADRRRTLAELLPENSALPDEQRTTVAATWSLSIELADQLSPPGLARPMLQLMSMLDANGIPSAILTSSPALEYLASHRAPLTPSQQTSSEPVSTMVNEDAAREALYCLHRLHLADFSYGPGERVVRVHGLIQRATRDQLTADQAEAVIRASAQALFQVWAPVHTTPESGILRANAEALRAHAGSQLWSLGAHFVLFEAGRSLSKDRSLGTADNYWRQLCLEAKRYLGPDHPDALLARQYAAGQQWVAGDRAGAIAAFENLLADRLRIHGPDHADTMATRGSLANLRGPGHRAGAVAAWEQLLADRLRVQGPDHADTLATRRSIATWRAAAGDQKGAVAALEELLSDHLRVQGPDHGDTLATRMALALQRGAAGDRPGAVAALEDLLADRLRIHGPDAPGTLTTRMALADQRGAAGDRPGAVADWEELLADRLRIYGPDHRDTLATRKTLASWRASAGDLPGAVAALEDLLADQLRIYGPDHRDTLATQRAIADRRKSLPQSSDRHADRGTRHPVQSSGAPISSALTPPWPQQPTRTRNRRRDISGTQQVTAMNVDDGPAAYKSVITELILQAHNQGEPLTSLRLGEALQGCFGLHSYHEFRSGPGKLRGAIERLGFLTVSESSWFTIDLPQSKPEQSAGA
jgi:hypothetical protein